MALPAQAGTAPATVPFVQGWADTGQISADDDWSRVAGIVGYRGDGLVAEPGTDPRGVTADGSGTPVDVAANLTDPRAVGLAETDPGNTRTGLVLTAGLLVALGCQVILSSFLISILGLARRGIAVQPVYLEREDHSQ